MDDNLETMIYTVPEVAKILHSSPNYVYALIWKGYLPAIKLKSIKVLKVSLEKFLIENQGMDYSDLNSVSPINASDIRKLANG